MRHDTSSVVLDADADADADGIGERRSGELPRTARTT
jgi:hypothetical protein